MITKIKNFIISFFQSKKTIDKEEFIRFFKLLKEHEYKPYEEIRHYQFNKLKYLINKVYEKSAFYKKKYDNQGFHPSKLRDMSDIMKIPTLSRKEIKKNSHLMIIKEDSHKIFEGYTSGTTGNPLKVFNDSISNAREWASICYQWERVGYNPTDGRVEFRGYIKKNVNFIHFAKRKILRINIVKMNDENVNTILKKIENIGYKFFHGYPSALFKFAKILERTGKEINPEAILLASEVLYNWQIEILDKIFPKAKKICHYGQAERVALGAWDDERKYKFIPTYGILEIDKSNNELIATGLINELMPIIRYRLTDSVEGIQLKPSKNDKTLFPIIEKIHGRIEDFSFNTRGDLIPPAVVTFPFKKLKEIHASKIIQLSSSELELMIEARESMATRKELKQLIHDLKKIYGDDMDINSFFVEKIPVDKSGKFRWIECKIKNSK